MPVHSITIAALKLDYNMSLMTLNTQGHQILGWWHYAKYAPYEIRKCQTVVRLLLNSNRMGKKQCMMCMTSQYDDITHILFNCQHLNAMRVVLWNSVISTCPFQLGAAMEVMSINERVQFILNAMNCEFVQEWSLVYQSLLYFIHTMYS